MAAIGRGRRRDDVKTFLSGGWTAFNIITGSYDPAVGDLSVTSGFSSHSPFSGVHDATLDGMLDRAAATLSTSSRAVQYQAIYRYISKKAYGVNVGLT